jgi:hypothetical protein
MSATVSELTYGHLAQALHELGFVEEVDSRGRTFTHASGARLPLPSLEDEDALRSDHLVASRGIVNDFGVMDAEDFDLLLLRISQAHEPAPAS